MDDVTFQQPAEIRLAAPVPLHPRELQSEGSLYVTPYPKPRGDIRYGRTSLRPERAPLGAYLGLVGGVGLALASRLSWGSLEPNPRVLGALAGATLALSALALLRKRGFPLAMLLLGACSVAYWLISLTALAQRPATAGLASALVHVGPGLWALLLGGFVASLASLANLPLHPTAKRHATPVTVELFADLPSGPLAMR